ncbi:RrF2 family transcriptional regulator [Clostridium uliginosum]|uniref:Rrf2 family protein n=1 Tax=Clostridium uliginosum TaxID=119641 RepID=A0A1I1PVE5_9CLOT|nr:Rrf2 family transcriptional regulator [Clostridium uliginosum]SFD13904.1 Rrf2 family protein [Clostridium uliginosum]
MRISSKARYGLAAMISIAQTGNNGDYITIISIAEKLGISKIYLEQVFSLLKRANLVVSIKGAQGGYHLARSAENIKVYDILNAIETSLFENTEKSVSNDAIEIEKSMNNLVWNKLDDAIQSTLSSATLNDLVKESQKYIKDNIAMFYI